MRDSLRGGGAVGSRRCWSGPVNSAAATTCWAGGSIRWTASGPSRCGSTCCSGGSPGGQVREVILATNPSMEGEVTATYVQQLLAGTGGQGHPAGPRAADGRRSGVRGRRHPGPRADRPAGGPLMRARRTARWRWESSAGRPWGGCWPNGTCGRHREDLFSPRPLRRLAALGHLAAQRRRRDGSAAAGLSRLGIAARCSAAGPKEFSAGWKRPSGNHRGADVRCFQLVIPGRGFAPGSTAILSAVPARVQRADRR